MHTKAAVSKDLDKNEAIQKTVHPTTSISPRETFYTLRPCYIRLQGESTLLLPAFKGCCLHLVMFTKMAAASYLNVNYCYDTRDNLTCFSNLFFLVIRCSNWKIFQGVTTDPKVRWRGAGASHRISAIDLRLSVRLAAIWMNCARNQNWSFWDQVGDIHDL